MHVATYDEQTWIDLNDEYNKLPSKLRSKKDDRWLLKMKRLGLPFSFCRVTERGNIEREVPYWLGQKKSVWIQLEDWNQLLEGKVLSKEVTDVPGLVGEDGFVHAYKLMGMAHRQVHHISHSKPFLKAQDILQKELGVTQSEIIWNDGVSVWWHPRLADWAAFHVDVSFAMKATKWIDDAKAKLPGVAEKHRQALASISSTPHDEDNVLEKTIATELFAELGGRLEVPTKNGVADHVTEDEVIEIKKAKTVVHAFQAVGQVNAYSTSFPMLRKRVHLFGSSREVGACKACTELQDYASHNNVALTYQVR